MKYTFISILLFFISCQSNKEKVDIRDIDIFKNTEIWDLAQRATYGSAEDFKRLVKEKSQEELNVKEEEYGFTLLMWLVKMEMYEEVKILLEEGANPNIRSHNGKTALFYAAEFSWLDENADADARFVDLLLDYGADPNIPYSGDGKSNVIEKGTTPLIHASARSFEKTKILVEGGANINHRTKRNWSAAYQALLNKKVDIAYYLIVKKNAQITEPYYYYINNTDSINFDDPRYPVELLRYWLFELGSVNHNKKLEIIKEFENQGVSYWATSVPSRIKDQIKTLYPNNFEYILSHY